MSSRFKQAAFAVTVAIPLTLVTATAQASTLQPTISETSPTLIDTALEAFWFEETATPSGGTYTIHNNTSNLTLIGFGVTNPDSNAVAGIDNGATAGFITVSNDYGGYYSGNPYTGDFWEAFNLGAGNWNDDLIWGDYYGTYTSAQTVFGDIGAALGADGYANYYQILDATGILAGETAQDFMFSSALPASSLFGVAVDDNNNTFAFITGASLPAVPLPAGLPLLLTGMGSLSLLKRKRRRKV